MKTILLLLIFAGFSFQSLISAPINQVGSLDEKDALKAPDGELLKRSKQHGISSSIDHLQELGTLDEAVLNRKDNGLPAKRDPWRRWRPNKRWRRKKQKSRCRRKEIWMDGCMDGWIRSTMEPTTTTTTPTAAVQDVSVNATGEPATSTITPATSTMEPTTTTTTPTAAVQGDVSVNATGEPATSTIAAGANKQQTRQQVQ
ncbi:uncharacterized protein LOC116295382 [Actinia tenebrosa]|uniref:Uncharacterized protein LOC116295382 n=1 Tax=Actinia tenebrosa TaxID=6105 RepID=A0A6P8HUR6_ACTTE|nr:uncharacterized protein LOC116295382 [Actinia tenebrosa]